jgi:FAD-dependent oxidoreductase domain-containing protein 1
VSDHFDIVIAGGAVMGSSIAYHLAAHPGFKGSILVVEPDPLYARSASALSAGSIRQQFSSQVNIRVSMHGIRFLRGIGETLAVDGEAPAIGLHEGGYLYITSTAEGAATLAEVNLLQQQEGADILLMDRAGLSARFGWLNHDDLVAGSWGRSGEGWFDGYGLMQAFRKKARSLGVTYREARVVAVERSGERIASVQLSDGTRIACGALVNAAGASGARVLAEKMGFAVPVFAKKRCVFSFECRTPLAGFPLLIDTSGVWVRPEGQGHIAGYSPDDLDEQDHGDDFSVDWPIFDETIWPALASRIPAFEQIRPGRAWAGHYDMCLLDHNALIGRMPRLANGYIACGFSGHGLQQSPAVGRGLAELMIDGRYNALDLSDLSPDRVISGKPLLERNVI